MLEQQVYKAVCLSYHAQVVHEAGAVLPDERGGAAERFHSDLLTAVQLPHSAHHHMHRVKQQSRGQLERGSAIHNSARVVVIFSPDKHCS